MIRHQELGLVQQGQVTLAGVTLNDHWDFVGVLLTDLLHVTLPLGCKDSGLLVCITTLPAAACYTIVHHNNFYFHIIFSYTIFVSHYFVIFCCSFIFLYFTYPLLSF